MTLVEVMVAASLALILLTLVHRFFVPILEVSDRVTHRAHLYRQATYALDTLSQDIQMTPASAISYRAPTTEQTALATFCPRRGISGKGYDLYRSRAVVYFINSSKVELRQRTWPPRPPEITKRIEPNFPIVFPLDELNAFDSTPDAGRLLATNVESFQPFTEWPPSEVVTSRLTLKRNVAGQKDALFELERKTTFRH